MPIRLNISPSIWQSYINAILDCLQSKKYCEAIMGDLLLFTPSKNSYMNKLEDLLQALLKNGLKISPKKLPKDSKRMQKFCRYGEFLKHVLPRATETIKTYL